MTVKRYHPLGQGSIVTSPFGPRRGGFHTGVDFGFPGGSAWKSVYAIQSGTVIFAGAADGYGGPDPAGWLVIDSTDAEGSGCLEYGHIVRRVNKGDHVKAGQLIAIINPDRSTNANVAPHLHVADMPHGYDPAAKQDVMPRLVGALDPITTNDPERNPVLLPPINQGDSMGWTGDPVWLADVLRAEGVEVVECFVDYPGMRVEWFERGHGDMGSLWGVINHHTGSNNSTWESIWHGRPDLAGPLSQIHLRRDGVAELVAVGVCWHAGTGNYGDLGRNQGNQRTIGVECQNDGTSGWPRAQYDALVKINAAFNRRIGVDSSHSIAHWEYDDGDPATDEGKWDPGGLFMPKFRDDVQVQIDNVGGFLMALTDDEQQELLTKTRYIYNQLGPGFDVWGEDGDLGRNDKGQRRTLRAGLAALMRKVGA